MCTETHIYHPQIHVADIEGIVLEEIKNRDPFVLKSREHLLIQKFDTFKNGLNKEH